MTGLVYTPPPSLVDFFTSNKFINLVIGPVGSTKTTAGILKVAHEARKIKACRDGIRRSRAIWIRQSREQLRDTSIPDWLRWFPDGVAGTFEKTNYKFTLKFADVECEVLFRGLDDSNDVRRLLSLQATFGIADEFRELNPDVFRALQARLGRYPSKADNGVGCQDDFGHAIDKFWGMSNPPDADTFWEQFISEPPSNADAWIQPSGMSPEADWLEYLKTDYYENLCEGKSQDWIDVYVHAKFGKSLAGQPVFRAFDRDIHVAKNELRPIRMSTHPLMIGFDFGLTPACTINQIDPQGRLLTYDNLTSDGMGALRFCREKLKPLLAQRFAGMNVLVIGDPAGQQRAQTDERSVFDILKQEGFRVIPARTNAIPARISAVDSWLTRMVDSKPAHLIDPRCRALIAALRGGYRYKLRTNGEMEDKPEKNMHSHIADAHQYACLHADGNLTGGSMRSKVQPVEKVAWHWA
ncbi:hypothetical protein [Paraburkholderia sp. BL10I2N1]|uniref:hypothetical protein n=1 Tax=Paraburkholderia sp. BL10I2N1 TaxID=1938796 RepID=UPI00105ED8BC|nr:hypothetical protein [Paraburkholderia sp. BL10I2N1]TDN70423.1 hypothetical protein B0G77_3897 [Paraburkholderia sp. BL10I2N1]